MDRYAVIGHPIAHSRSPWIHARFAEQTGQAMRYEAIDAPPASVREVIRTFFRDGGRGMNVTLPHKGVAYEMAGIRSTAAEYAEAVNTLTLAAGGQLRGDTTDGVGLVRDLTVNLGWPIAGRRVLLLGAGGASRGVLGPVLGQGPAELWVVNRTVQRAQQLVERFGAPGGLTAAGFVRLHGAGAFDLIINATSAGIAGGVPPVPPEAVSGRTVCYDMIYGRGQTAFQQWALSHGAAGAEQGAGMLVEQAAESFLIWRRVRPDTATVLAALKAELAA